MNELFNSVKNTADKAMEKASNAAEGVKNSAAQLREGVIEKQAERKAGIAERKRLDDIKKYSPIFAEDVLRGDLKTERFIRIINYDARLENETCKDSVGYYEKSNDRRLATLYIRKVPSLGFSFYPQMLESVFVADPCISGKYIEIDEYFNYMKQVRVNELTVVAQALGASSVTIELRHASKSLFHNSLNANAKAGQFVDGSVNREETRKNARSIDIWAKTTFRTGVFNANPTVPELLYFRNESDIAALIQMVLVNKSRVTERKYTMKASSSSGVSLTEAASITGMLKGIKCSAGASFAKSAESESKAFLDYTIVF